MAKDCKHSLKSLAKKVGLGAAALYGGYMLTEWMGHRLERWRLSRSDLQPRIIIIGAGISGLCMAIKLKHELQFDNFVIYEMQSDLGGTWFANTYPGCCCDVPGHLYSFSFCPNPLAKRAYPTQSETLQYLQDVADKYDLRKHIEFETQVIGCKYLETEHEAKWTVTIRRRDTTTTVCSHFVCSATGLLTIPKYPSSMGNISEFKGKTMHSAVWDHEFNFDGKKVAIIGTGCSSIQVTPSLCERFPGMDSLHVYQRSPGHIFPKEHAEFSPLIKALFLYLPLALKLHRWWLYWRSELLLFPGLKKGSRTNAKLTDLSAIWNIDKCL